MKKSLIALAVLGSVVGMAQAQSSVTLYGIADVAVLKDKGGAYNLASGGVSQSRLGFKGVEELGGGVKAVFLLEHGFNIDSGTTAGTAFWNRQSYVGLAGGFGEVRLGKIWTAYDDISGATNSVWDSALSPTNGVFLSTGYNGNPNNGVYYVSPTMGGVSAALSTTATEGAATPRVSAVNVKYEAGNVFAGAAFQREQGAGTDNKFVRVNGSYDFGVAKAVAAYGRVKDAAGVKTNEGTIGVYVPVTAKVVVSAGYATSKTEGAERVSGAAIGAAYLFSKRTLAYGGYLDTKKSATGPDSRVAVGLQHSF